MLCLFSQNMVVNLPTVLIIVFTICTESSTGSSLKVIRAAKCIIPNGEEHVVRAALLQQCISENYGQGNETQCYPELGCFPMDSPWTTLTRPLPNPHPPEEINTRLYCYSSTSPTRYNISLWPEIELNGCQVDPCGTVVFIIHGFATNGNFSWPAVLKDKYLQKVKNATVFIVDWGNGAQLFNYFQVASNTRIVGSEISRFMRFLMEKCGVDNNNIHLIGHSLGAHICGYAAKPFIGNKTIGRITGMDTAQPCFEKEDPLTRLHIDDAKYVEGIHTNACPFIPFFCLGYINNYGHVDMYVNGGGTQPGCLIPDDLPKISSLSDLGKWSVEALSKFVSCSHSRAYEYYTTVLDDNCNIWGRAASLPRSFLNALSVGVVEPVVSALKQCSANTCIPLGLESINYRGRGNFAASATGSYPYCETDPEKNKKVLTEIKDNTEEDADNSYKVKDTVKDAAGKGTAVVSTLARKLLR